MVVVQQRRMTAFFEPQQPAASGDRERVHAPSTLESPGKFVDLFAGIGGASTGAMNAGYDVVLAVDSWKLALDVHRRNHPHTKHLCIELPPTEPLPLPAAGERWHLHGSPPCTKLSGAARYARDDARVSRETAEGLEMVKWYLDFALASHATTWSMEQVNHEGVRRLLQSYSRPCSPHRNNIAWAIFNCNILGVPQNRKRIIAGSPKLISHLRCTRKRRVAVREVISHPRGTHIRNETLYQGKRGMGRIKYNKDGLCKSINTQSHTIVAYKPLRWTTPSDSEAPLKRLSTYESSRIQGFPEGYALPAGVVNGGRGVGNAVPPPVMQHLLTPRARCVSPSLLWRPSS